MKSYHEILLHQEEPLEPHEVASLKAWLKVLEGDVEVFGTTTEDEERMAAIRDRIATEEARPRIDASM